MRPHSSPGKSQQKEQREAHRPERDFWDQWDIVELCPENFGGGAGGPG